MEKQTMASSRKATVVTVPFEKLCDPNADLTKELWQGYGPDGLGVITVSNVPDFPALREQLLPLAQQFADLPDDVKQTYEHPASSYNFGWSHGKEAMRSGKPDTHKGSFYANPVQDTYNVDPGTAAKYKTYYSPNIWPTEHLPQLETAVKQLGSLIVSVGLKLAAHCSKYVQEQLSNATGEPLPAEQQQQLDFAGQLSSSTCHKARLLHYFPVDHNSPQQDVIAVGNDEDWCGWHLDHGALTGLTSAMYIKDGKQVPNPDPGAGLYICNRAGEVVQASIPADHIAYQMGQVMAIQSGGLLRATPHYVRAATRGEPGVSRNTFAVFMQPETSMRLEAPQASETISKLLCVDMYKDSGHWEPGMTFGEFAERTMHGYYAAPASTVSGAGVAGLARSAAAAPAKEVAPAAALLAEAASRKQVQLHVSHV